jgi:hypothetical protein
MVYTLNASNVAGPAPKIERAMFAAVVCAVGIFFLWFFVQFGFTEINNKSNPDKVIGWTLDAIGCGFVTWMTILLMLSAESNPVREDIGWDVGLIVFYVTSIVTGCAVVAYAATVFSTGNTLLAIITGATVVAAYFMWVGFTWCVKCHHGAKLP